MKRFKVRIAMLLALLLLLPVPFAGTLNSKPSGSFQEIPDFDWSNSDVGDWEDDEDIIDGGHLGEATITCSSKGWGRCYEWRTDLHGPIENPVIYSSYGFFSGCFPTGSMEDRCRIIWHLLYTAMMAANYDQY